MRTILLFFYLIIFMVGSLLGFIPYIFIRLLGTRKAVDRYTALMTHIWSRSLLFVTGAQVTVYGREHIPEGNSVCFVSNHQGIADILLISGNVPKVIGFIAKKELKKVPIINIWMLITYCIFIDRGNIRQAADVIDQGARHIRRGHSMVVFPEGTRSRGPKMGTFKRGSIKLALRSESLIVPLTVSGTYKLFEEHNRIQPAEVVLRIHPPIDTRTLTAEQRRELPQKLAKTIEGGLHEISQ